MSRKFMFGSIATICTVFAGWLALSGHVAAQDLTPTPPDVAPTIVIELEATPTADPANQIAPTPFGIPTPSADGKMYYVVQPGDSLIRIASIVCGPVMSCVDTVKQLNNLDSNIISVGQKLIVGPIPGKEYPFSLTPSAALATPTTPATATAVTPTELLSPTATTALTSDAALTVIPSATTALSAATSEPLTPVVTATLADSGQQITPTSAPGTASVCVRLYDDTNGNGVLDSNEQSLAGGQFALVQLQSGDTVGTHPTDLSIEPHCFEALISGEYRVIATLPTGYTPTTADNWNFSLAAGSTANLEFGAQGSAAASPTPANTNNTNNRTVLTALLGAFGVIFLVLAAGWGYFPIGDTTQPKSEGRRE